MIDHEFPVGRRNCNARIIVPTAIAFAIWIAITGCGEHPRESAKPETISAKVPSRAMSHAEPVSVQSDTGHVTAAASLPPQPMLNDQPIVATVTLSIQRGYHIYAQVDSDGPFTSLSIRGAASVQGVRALPTILPAPRAIADGHPIFRDTVEVSVPLEVLPDFQGRFVLSTKVTYQACNDLACFPEETLVVDLPVLITPNPPHSKGDSL